MLSHGWKDLCEAQHRCDVSTPRPERSDFWSHAGMGRCSHAAVEKLDEQVDCQEAQLVDVPIECGEHIRLRCSVARSEGRT
jgi:hypothetical protein